MPKPGSKIDKVYKILDEHNGQLTLDDMKALYKKFHGEVMLTQMMNQYANKWEVERGKKYLRKKEKGILSGKKKELFELYDQGIPSREAWKVVNCWPNYARQCLEEWEAHYDTSFVEGKKRA
jgi:hypothetical protein